MKEKLVVCQDPEHAVGELTELLLGKEDGSQKVSVLSLRERARKKLLVLTSWKDSREHKFITRQLLNRLQEKDMDTVILSSWTADEEEFQGFCFRRRCPCPGDVQRPYDHGRRGFPFLPMYGKESGCVQKLCSCEGTYGSADGTGMAQDLGKPDL